MGQIIQSRNAQHIVVDGRPLVIFCSNDYLGLSHHAQVLEAAARAAQEFGCGTGGAPGTSGTTRLYIELAHAIAEFKHRDKAVIFPSGYAANVAIHQALGGENTSFYCEQKHHPSAIDGIKLSGCPRLVFDCHYLGNLAKTLAADKHSQKVVTLPSVFTVTGDIAPLPELIELKQKYGFLLILDEAHATGCLGQTGRGIEEMYSLIGVADFIMGTFSKALGSQGGFLAFSNSADRLLARSFRPFIYSTSISAMAVAASLKSLEILQTNPGLVSQMRQNIAAIHDSLSNSGLSLNKKGTHIVNVYFPTRDKTRRVIDNLFNLGYFVVELHLEDKFGLRITAMATHTTEEITGFCKSLVAATE